MNINELMEMPEMWGALPFKGTFIFVMVLIFCFAAWVFESLRQDSQARGTWGVIVLPTVFSAILVGAAYITLKYTNFIPLVLGIFAALALVIIIKMVDVARSKLALQKVS